MHSNLSPFLKMGHIILFHHSLGTYSFSHISIISLWMSLTTSSPPHFRRSACILSAPGALLFLNAFSEIFISSNVGSSEDAVSLSSLMRPFPPLIGYISPMYALPFCSSWNYSFHLCFVPCGAWYDSILFIVPVKDGVRVPDES
jgi:hypothetical protein